MRQQPPATSHLKGHVFEGVRWIWCLPESRAPCFFGLIPSTDQNTSVVLQPGIKPHKFTGKEKKRREVPILKPPRPGCTLPEADKFSNALNESIYKQRNKSTKYSNMFDRLLILTWALTGISNHRILQQTMNRPTRCIHEKVQQTCMKRRLYMRFEVSSQMVMLWQKLIYSYLIRGTYRNQCHTGYPEAQRQTM